MSDRWITCDPAEAFERKPHFFVGAQKLGLCNPDDWQVVVFADAPSAVSATSRRQIEPLAPCRRYAFVLDRGRRDRGAQLWLEAASGAVIYYSPRAQRPLAPAWVEIAICNQQPLPSTLDALERKRRGIWQSDDRNNAITSIANALRKGQLSRLKQHGFAADTISQWQKVIKEIGKKSVYGVCLMIVVEVLEHARQLLALLKPHAEIVAVTESKDENEWLLSETPILIATASQSKKLGVDNLRQIIIRADGTATTLADMIGRWPRTSPESLGGTYPLLIDFADGFDDRARRDARIRQGEYATNTWRVFQPPPPKRKEVKR